MTGAPRWAQPWANCYTGAPNGSSFLRGGAAHAASKIFSKKLKKNRNKITLFQNLLT
jgi:hypothetical protein